MTRYHATPEGQVPFTAEEESEWDAKEAEYAAQAPLRFIAEVTVSTQQRLDEFARTRNYDGILSACTYASSAIPKFQTEGQYCVNSRDATWATLYSLMADVQSGTILMPSSVAEVMAILPELVWPTI